MKWVVLCIILGCMLWGVGHASTPRAGQTRYSSVTVPGQEGARVIVKGKIAYMKALGGYYVVSEEPAGEFMISNQDVPLLAELMKSGDTVVIHGRLPMGADLLIIDSIDGRTYKVPPGRVVE